MKIHVHRYKRYLGEPINFSAAHEIQQGESLRHFNYTRVKISMPESSLVGGYSCSLSTQTFCIVFYGATKGRCKQIQWKDTDHSRTHMLSTKWFPSATENQWAGQQNSQLPQVPTSNRTDCVLESTISPRKKSFHTCWKTSPCTCAINIGWSTGSPWKDCRTMFEYNMFRSIGRVSPTP